MTTQRVDDGDNYTRSNVMSINPKPIENKSYSLPLGRIFHAPVSIGAFLWPCRGIRLHATDSQLLNELIINYINDLGHCFFSIKCPIINYWPLSQ